TTVSMTGPTSVGTGLNRWVQSSTPNWSVGFHTNLLTFSDNAAGSYTYTWVWNCLGGSNRVNEAGSTHGPVLIPLSARVDPSTLSVPGVLMHAHQMPFRENNGLGTSDQQLEDLHGPNLSTLVPRDINGNLYTGSHNNATVAWPGPVDFRFSSGT